MVKTISTSLQYFGNLLKQNQIYGTEIRILVPMSDDYVFHLEVCERDDMNSSIAEVVQLKKDYYKLYFVTQNSDSRTYPDFNVCSEDLFGLFDMIKQVTQKLHPFMEKKSVSQVCITIRKEDEIYFNEEMELNFLVHTSKMGINPVKIPLINFKPSDLTKILSEKFPEK